MEGFIKMGFKPHKNEEGKEIRVEVSTEVSLSETSPLDIVNIFSSLSNTLHVDDHPEVRMMLALAFSTNTWPNTPERECKRKVDGMTPDEIQALKDMMSFKPDKED